MLPPTPLRLFIVLALAILAIPVSSGQTSGTSGLDAPTQLLQQDADATADSLRMLVRRNAAVIDSFRAQAAQVGGDREARIASLQEAVNTLRDQFEQERRIERSAERLRFTTTLDVLVRLASDGGKFEFLSARDKLVSGFRNATDLAQDPNVLALVQHSKGEDSEMPVLASAGAFLENPIVSTVLTVARLFTSTRKPAERAEALGGALCALDIATASNVEAVSVRALLAESSRRVESIEPDALALLSDQLTLVGYTPVRSGDPAAAYIRVLEDGQDPVRELLDQTLDGASPAVINRARAHASRANELGVRYNDALRSYGDFLASFTNLIEQTSRRSCVGTVTTVDRKDRPREPVSVDPFPRVAELAALIDESQRLEKRFPRVYRPISPALLDRLVSPQLATGM